MLIMHSDLLESGLFRLFFIVFKCFLAVQERDVP
jgi:hypothetical protein